MHPPCGVAALEVENLCVAYAGRTVLRDVSFVCPQGVILGVVGPNGAGKSSLLKAILGLVSPSSGSVRLLGCPAWRSRRHVAYVPQREAVDWDFPVTVWDVVMMGRVAHMGWLRRPSRQDVQAVREALLTVGLLELADRPIGRLSGGQQQRTFVARALAQQAPLLLLDEPFSGVDALTQQVLFQVMDGLRREGRTVVVVHHDLTAAQRYDLVLLLNGSPVAFGPPELVMTPYHLQRTYGGLAEPPASGPGRPPQPLMQPQPVSPRREARGSLGDLG